MYLLMLAGPANDVVVFCTNLCACVGLPPQSGSAAPGYSTNLASLTSSLSSLGAG